MAVMERTTEIWMALSLEERRETQETLHMWTQVVAKVSPALAPFFYEWWNIAFAITPRGLTTGPIPAGDRVSPSTSASMIAPCYSRSATGAARCWR